VRVETCRKEVISAQRRSSDRFFANYGRTAAGCRLCQGCNPLAPPWPKLLPRPAEAPPLIPSSSTSATAPTARLTHPAFSSMPAGATLSAASTVRSQQPPGRLKRNARAIIRPAPLHKERHTEGPPRRRWHSAPSVLFCWAGRRAADALESRGRRRARRNQRRCQLQGRQSAHT